MKRNGKPHFLPGLILGLGTAAMVLRFLIYKFAPDERGLIPQTHPLLLALWAVGAVAALCVIFFVYRLEGSNRYADNFTASPAAAAGAVGMAVCTAATVLLSGSGDSALEKIRLLLGLAASGGLVWVAFSRAKGKRPFLLGHLAVTLFLAVHMVACYRYWSSMPQPVDYLLSMAAVIFLLLFAFYQTAFDVGSGKRRMQLGVGLLAVFCSLGAIPSSDYPLLYFGGWIWAVTNLCTCDPVPRKKQEAPAPAPKE